MPRTIIIRGRILTTPEEVMSPDGYWPSTRFIPRDQAEHLRPVVVQIVSAGSPQTVNRTHSDMKIVYRFVAWADDNAYATEPKKLCVPARVEEFHAVGLPGRDRVSRDAARGVLRRLGRLSSPKTWEPETVRCGPKGVLPPYTPDQVSGLFKAVEHQSTAHRREALSNVLNLGLGCGLWPNDYLWIKAEDVVCWDDGLTAVRVPEPADHSRWVPVLDRYAPAVRAMAASCPTGRPLVGDINIHGKDPVTAYLHRTEIPAWLPNVTVQRLRRTWAVTVLSGDVRLSEFMVFSGLTSTGPLEALLPFVPVREDADNTAFRKVAASGS